MNSVEKIAQYATGHWVSQMVFAFAKNGMGDAFQLKAATSVQIAERTGVNEDNCYRLLRALTPLGLLEQNNDTFQLTEMGEYLTKDHPMSLVDKVLLEASYEHVLLWTHLADYMVNSTPAPKAIFDLDNYFNLFETRPEHLDVFSKAMGSYSKDEIAMVESMPNLDLSNINTLTDLGGAYGDLLTSILNRYPNIEGTLFDQAAVIENAPNTERMTKLAGNFFDAVPAEQDGYFLKHILHDWDDNLCLTILGNIKRVMKPTSRIFIAEFGPIPESSQPHLSKLFDLHMMLTLNGMERSLTQWQQLLDKAGLRIKNLHESFGPLSILEVIIKD
ncbi:hypothetical protein A9Q77_10385 [Marinomonas sp. 42_23_T18]|nr:hypothetical protein A9Q77_10385 [Marinomonas sp. 42_23_T18]